MRTTLILLTLLAAPVFAQRPEDFLSGLSEYRSLRNMLPAYLDDKAMRLLDQRKQNMAQLSGATGMAARKALLREKVQRALGEFPPRTPLNARLTGVLERDGYKIEKIIFESQPGFYVTANLYLPSTGTGPWPAVLYPLGHEAGAKAYPIWQTMLGSLARKGYVALTWDPLGQGERVQFYDPDLEDSKLRGSTTEHSMLAAQCLLTGHHIARYTIWDGMRALDYLLSRKEVDAARVACTGNSGGGTHTTYLSALDDRIKVAAASCYLSSWKRMIESLGPQDGEQNFTSFIENGLDYPDYLYSFGPKPFLILSAIRDFFPIDGARETFQEARRLYGDERLALVEADDGHGYSKPRRMAAYRWFGRWLKGAEDNEPEPEIRVASAEELFCTPTGQISTALGGEDVFSLNRKRADQLKARRAGFSAGQARQLLRFEPPKSSLNIKTYGTIDHPGYRIEKLVFDSEPGILIPSLLYVPAGGPQKKPAIVYADGAGKSAGGAEAFVNAGFVVLSIDLRGMGETQPGETDRSDRPFGDYRDAMMGFLVGKPLVGMRAQDIARAVDLVTARPEVDAARIAGFGKGGAAVPMLFAAALDTRIAQVALENMLVSYDSVARYRLHQRVFEQVIPGVLESFDLPDVAKAVAPRPVWIVNAANPLGHRVALAEARREYAGARVTERLDGIFRD